MITPPPSLMIYTRWQYFYTCVIKSHIIFYKCLQVVVLILAAGWCITFLLQCRFSGFRSQLCLVVSETAYVPQSQIICHFVMDKVYHTFQDNSWRMSQWLRTERIFLVQEMVLYIYTPCLLSGYRSRASSGRECNHHCYSHWPRLWQQWKDNIQSDVNDQRHFLHWS